MKTLSNVGFACVAGILLSSVGSSKSQTLVGPGSPYPTPFGTDITVTHDVPGGGFFTLALDDNTTSGSTDIWDLTAQGGANLTALVEVVNSGAQTQIVNNSLEFNLSQSPSSLLGSLGVGASIHYAWSASGVFDQAGSVITYLPNTRYSVSFNVDGTNGLLGSVVGVIPQFSVELIDGNGNALDSNGYGSLIDIAGLLGSGVPSGTVNLTFDTGGIAPVGSLGVRFRGDSFVSATALGIGDNFATIDGLNITAGPIPEPTHGILLLGSVAGLFLKRRRGR